MALQARHGNAFVQRIWLSGQTPPELRRALLHAEPPSLLREDAPSADSVTKQAEEEKAAAERARQAVQQTLDLKALKPNLLLLPVPVTLPPPNPLAGPAPKEPEPLVPAGAGPSEPKEASAGDLGEAIMKVPAVDRAVTNLKDKALSQVKRDWKSLSTGEKVITISASALVAGGALAGVASDPESRQFVLGQLDGKVIPVPGLDALGVELNTKGNNVMVGLHLDVGKVLPKELGFGPASFAPIGPPPGMP